jgi:hypothetical protein
MVIRQRCRNRLIPKTIEEASVHRRVKGRSSGGADVLGSLSLEVAVNHDSLHFVRLNLGNIMLHQDSAGPSTLS